MTAEKMPEYDGFLFGMSGRYGSFPAQMKTFMDSTGSLWMNGALVGKAAGMSEEDVKKIVQENENRIMICAILFSS